MNTQTTQCRLMCRGGIGDKLSNFRTIFKIKRISRPTLMPHAGIILGLILEDDSKNKQAEKQVS